jgi:hypothetical protein
VARALVIGAPPLAARTAALTGLHDMLAAVRDVVSTSVDLGDVMSLAPLVITAVTVEGRSKSAAARNGAFDTDEWG